jgi:hypothetical protein
MTGHTRAITIAAKPDAIWPWLVQIGDRRAGFYSYDWVERYQFPALFIESRAGTRRRASTPSFKNSTGHPDQHRLNRTLRHRQTGDGLGANSSTGDWELGVRSRAGQ